ncbi:SEC-C domain-containing protein [Burkholderia cenocepacia]|uniref:SEC-C domain-containing protein n=1 Tax=Burkholderia cenocepacia TaxID=95486 RepID=UPI0023B8BFFC|nr:SEC-C domain-containing protein [Burkholderia cenocepacia]MDF0500881.1 SEC-C domain-containing protein [Burkholderia cenocepacia]MDT6993229.1 SEC-C metal-binding domain-containing protein [Burkholderia cenocepacia]
MGGLYQGADDVLKIFLDPAVPAEQLRRLKEILEGAAQTGATAEQTAQQIAESAPAFVGINGWLNRNAPIINTIGVLAALASLVVALNGAPTEEQLAKAFEHAISQALEKRQTAPAASSLAEPKGFQRILAPVNGISQNAPCPCGSGKKYKHCHGKKRFQI